MIIITINYKYSYHYY